jgi:hypothetical protein
VRVSREGKARPRDGVGSGVSVNREEVDGSWPGRLCPALQALRGGRRVSTMSTAAFVAMCGTRRT